ncbi:MAG: glycosyltransferase family 2 protein, partial [Actinomycetota bacterium]
MSTASTEPVPARPAPRLGIILPARDEAAALPGLLGEIRDVLDARAIDAEVIVVDDGSRDATAACGVAAADWDVRFRVVSVRTSEPAAAGGQTMALACGIAAARGTVVAMLDADGQNDPADLPRLLDRFNAGDVDLVQGDRTASRCDGWRRRVASAVGRAARRAILGDRVRDTGCTLRVIDADVARALPLDRPGMHRFIPVLAASAGARIAERP